MLDGFLFVSFPYLALAVGVTVAILRLRDEPCAATRPSIQPLDGEQLFWGTKLWLYGMIGVLTGHFLGLIFPASILTWNAQPVRLFILEGTGLALALMALGGAGLLVTRRIGNSRLRAASSPVDWVVMALLLFEVVSGIEVALRLRWGSSWYASNAAPWLQSLCTFHPRMEFVQPLPWDAKLHLLNAFLIIALTPFSRLAHALPLPFARYWRRPLILLLNRRSSGARV